MTIAINGSMLDHQPSGLGVYTINLINQLHLLYRNNTERKITVFTPSYNLLNPELDTVKLMDCLQSSKYGKIAAGLRFFWNTFIYPVSARNCDLLISPTTHASLTSSNQILTIHDLLSLRFRKIRMHQRLYYKHLLPFMVRRARLIIAVSEATKKDIIDFLGCPENKIKVVYNGYDPLKFNQWPVQNVSIHDKYHVANYFLVVGPTYSHKNIELLIDAYADLDHSVRNSHHVVIAGGMRPYLDRLKRLAAAKGVNRFFHFLGYVPDSHIAALYQEAFALVFPSLYEGFGFPVLEAMACGCPVICSNTSSMPEICSDAAYYVDPTKKESLTGAMAKLSFDPELRLQLKARGVQRAATFSWEQTAAQIKNLIELNLNNQIVTQDV